MKMFEEDRPLLLSLLIVFSAKLDDKIILFQGGKYNPTGDLVTRWSYNIFRFVNIFLLDRLHAELIICFAMVHKHIYMYLFCVFLYSSRYIVISTDNEVSQP